MGIVMLLSSAYMQSFPSFLVLFGLGYGICNGLTYMVPMHHGWLWFPKSPGLVSGIVIGGFGFGSLIFGNVARILVNPDNVQADPDTGYYPSDVSDNVPKMMKILVLCWAAIAIVSIFLIFPGKDHTDIKEAGKAIAEGGDPNISSNPRLIEESVSR